MYPLCSTSPKYNQVVNKQKLYCHVELHLVSSNLLTGQILSIENFFMSKALAKIKRLRSKPIFICDICCPRVGNDRRRCLLDESLFLFFFFSFFFFLLWLRAKLAREIPQNRWLSVIGPYKDWQLIFWGENCMTAAKGTGNFFTEKKTKRFVISSPGSFRHRWKWAEMTLGSRLKKKNNSKKITNQIHINALLTKWKVNLAGYWPNGESAIHKKKLTRKLFFFRAYTLQWLYFTVVSSVSLRYIIKKRKLLPKKGPSENTSAKCAYEKLVNGELNLFHSGYFT